MKEVGDLLNEIMFTLNCISVIHLFTHLWQDRSTINLYIQEPYTVKCSEQKIPHSEILAMTGSLKHYPQNKTVWSSPSTLYRQIDWLLHMSCHRPDSCYDCSLQFQALILPLTLTVLIPFGHTRFLPTYSCNTNNFLCNNNSYSSKENTEFHLIFHCLYDKTKIHIVKLLFEELLPAKCCPTSTYFKIYCYHIFIICYF